MSQQRDLALLVRIRSGGEFRAKEELVEKYLPMIRYIVKNQNQAAAEYDDCFQEGALGLLKAIEQYNYERYTVKFSTFAYICILRRIYNKIKQNYTKKTMLLTGAVSLDSPCYEDSDRTLLQAIPGNGEDPLEGLEREWHNKRLKLVLQAYLSPLEFEVVQLLLKGYGLLEIEKILGIPSKVVDNARTRSRLKLKKLVLRYGSLVDPGIPMKTRKRNDLAMAL